MTSVAQADWFSDPALRRVLDLLNADGGEARVVGGAVRNTLMGLPVSDMDIATSLRPEEVVARAERAAIKCVPTGLKHGTVTLVVEGRPFEVTTLRRDVETDGRHAEVAFTTDWKADAERRDLTINALYADKDGLVHDYADGLADIEKANIRFIGDAAQRIAEDHLRILRFFRFFAHYGRGRPDAAGIKASATARDSLEMLSAERVWSEIKKLLSATDPFRALLWMRTAGVLTKVLPETEKWGIDAMPALVEAESRFGWEPDPMRRLAAIVPPDEPRLGAMADRLRFSSIEKKIMQDFSTFPAVKDDWSSAQLRALLYRHGSTGADIRLKLALASAAANAGASADGLEKIGRLNAMVSATEAWEKPQMPVKGSDLIAVGFPAGPEIGERLSVLEQRWIESDFKLDRDALMATLAN